MNIPFEVSEIEPSKIPEPRLVFYLIGFLNFILIAWVIIGIPVAIVFFVLGLVTKDPIQRKKCFQWVVLGVSGVFVLVIYILLAMVLLSIPGFSQLIF